MILLPSGVKNDDDDSGDGTIRRSQFDSISLVRRESSIDPIRFYRATLCVSAVLIIYFSRCHCLRPSVTSLDCIHTAEDIVELLSRPGSSTILVF